MVVNKGQKDTDVSRRTSEMPRRGLVGWFDAVRANQAGRLTLRIVVGVLGAILVGGGLLLVPLPGPGWLIVFAGLALLATEFAWAAHVLQFGRRTLESWTGWLMRQGWTVRVLVSAITLAFAGIIAYFMVRLTIGIDMVQEFRHFIESP